MFRRTGLAVAYVVAVFAHALVHCVDGPVALATPSHFAMLLSAVAVLGYTLRPLVVPRSERRRRLALLRSALRARPHALPLAVALQTLFVAALLLSEGALPSAGHAGIGALCILAVALLGALFTRETLAAVEAVAAALCELVAPRGGGLSAFARPAVLPARGVVGAAARPVRAPPIA